MGNAKQKQGEIQEGKRPFKQWAAKYRMLLIVAAVVFIGIETFITQYTRYVYHTVRCGHQPISAVHGTNFAGGSGIGSYYIPGLPGHSFKGYNKEYFCSTDAAARAGYELGTFDRGSPLPYVDEFYDNAPECT